MIWPFTVTLASFTFCITTLISTNKTNVECSFRKLLQIQNFFAPHYAHPHHFLILLKNELTEIPKPFIDFCANRCNVLMGQKESMVTTIT